MPKSWPATQASVTFGCSTTFAGRSRYAMSYPTTPNGLLPRRG
jgi:hypothetical protein